MSLACQVNTWILFSIMEFVTKGLNESLERVQRRFLRYIGILAIHHSLFQVSGDLLLFLSTLYTIENISRESTLRMFGY